MVDCVVKAGADKRHAIQLAEVLASGDYRNQYGHGLNRLRTWKESWVLGPRDQGLTDPEAHQSKKKKRF